MPGTPRDGFGSRMTKAPAKMRLGMECFVKFILIALCLLPMLMQSAEVEITGSTATQAVLTYRAPTAAACEVVVSESESLTPPVNDVNEALFPGASLDSASAIGAQDSGQRVLVVGKRIAQLSGARMVSRALRADTDHFARVTCDGETTEVARFRTARIAGMVPADSGFNPEGHGNWGVPDFDWTDRTKPVIDPLTGAAIFRLTDPADAGFQTTRNFANYFGGDAWTNVNNVLSGTNSALARTANANPIFLGVDTAAITAYGGHDDNGWPRLSAMAVRLFGNGSDGNAENRQVDVCLSVDSGQSCYTDAIRVTLGQSTAEVAIPAQFPVSNFTGWSRPIPAHFWTTTGHVTVNGNNVTLSQNRDREVITFPHPKTGGSWFRPEWVAGTRIFIAGSSPACAQNYCTIASVQNRTNLTIVESISVTDAFYRAAALGVRIAKTNSTGNVSLSASVRMAAFLGHHNGAADMCSPLTVTTSVTRLGAPLGRTITGRLCVINRVRDTAGRLYFVGESEPETRLLSMNAVPTSIPDHTQAELPSGGGFLTSSNAFWSATNPNAYYLRAGTNAGSPSVFRLVYSGDYRENTGALWSYSLVGLVSAPDPVRWSNIFKGSKAPRLQILANTTYDESRWPSLTNLQFGGIVERKLFFFNLLASQDLPCAVFTFDTETGNFERWFDTLGNGIGGTKFAGCHGLRPYGKFVFLSARNLLFANPAVRYGGPFLTDVTHVIRNGAPSTNTALPEAPDGSYDAACPTDIKQLFKNMGAVGNECVTVRVSAEPCSVTPEANERVWTPCPSNPARSWVGKPVEPGDVIQDYGKSYNPGTDLDSEHMLIVKRRDLTGGAIELVLLRDSATGYACQIARARGRSCVAVRNQAQHAAGWNMVFRPLSGTILYDPATGEVDIENDAVGRGHFNIVQLPEDRHTFVGISAEGYGTRVNADSYAFSPVNTITRQPAFAGIRQTQSFAQSYPSTPTAAAKGTNMFLSTDWRHINSVFGSEWEAPGQTMGSPLTYTLQAGTTSVYKIGPVVGLTDYKREHLTMWAGLYVMGEKSGPDVNLTDADTWQFCYAYRAGECRVGSAQGELFAVIPQLETTIDRCHASQTSYRTPCLFVTGSVETQVVQFRIDRNEPTGVNQRSVGHSLTRPGAQSVYSSARMFGDSPKILSTVHHHNGWFTGAVLIDPGQMPDDSVNRTTYLPLQISGLPEGSLVEFGYTPQFFCTARQEACRVSSAALSEGQPFAYAHETLTPTQSSTNVITVPMLSGRVLYYRVVTNGEPGPVNVFAAR